MHPSFHHVYVPPWAVPAAPPQQTVRAFREAGTQTSTGAIQARPHASHTADDVADHFRVGPGLLVMEWGPGTPTCALVRAQCMATAGQQAQPARTCL